MGAIVMFYSTVPAVGTSFRPRHVWAGHDYLSFTEAQSQGFTNILTRLLIRLTNFEHLLYTKSLASGNTPPTGNSAECGRLMRKEAKTVRCS